MATANSRVMDQCIISNNFLDEFEPNLLSHAISIFNLHQIKVNAFSLATKTDFFLRRYQQVANGTAQEPLVMTPEDIGDPRIFRIIVYFCHFDRLRDMDILMLRDTLAAAVHFKCRNLEKYATEFAASQLSLETALAIWQQVSAFPDLPVAETVRTFVLRHFLVLAHREDFRELSAEALADLLSNERLNIWQEDLLVEPLLRWTRGRVTPLWDQMRLLASIRFHRLSDRARTALRQMDGFKYFSGFRRSPMFRGMCCPDEFRLSHEGVLLVGGTVNGVPTGKAMFLDPRSGQVSTRLAHRYNLPEPRLEFAIAVLDDCRVFVAGGRKGKSRLRHTAECLCLDLSESAASWQPVAALHEARSGLSAVVCNSALYAIGGENFAGYLATVESLEETRAAPTSRRSRWRLRAPLPEGRSEPGVACVGGRVVACGGYRGSVGERQACSLVHWYDPKEDQWTRVTSMWYPRAGPSVLALQNAQLLVVGGNTDAPSERLQFSASGQPSWVSSTPAPQLQLANSSSCVADSQWLLVNRGDPDDPETSSSIATLPVECLNSGQQQDLSSLIRFLPELGVRDFAVATVAGTHAMAELLEEAVWPSNDY